MRNKLSIRSLSFVLLCLTFLHCNNIVAQDTLYVEYNRETKMVLLVQKGSNICFNPNGVFEVDIDVVGSLDAAGRWSHMGDKKKVQFKVLEFDTTSISNICAKKYDTDGNVLSNTDIFVDVNITPKPQAETEYSSSNNDTKDAITPPSSSKGMIIIVSVIIVVIVALLFIWKAVGKRKKNNLVVSIEQKGAELGLEVVEVVSSVFKEGLDHVHKSKDSYYLINVERDFKNTAIHKIYLHHSAIKKMYDFFKGSLESAEKTNETGCYFIGCWESSKENPLAYNISVEDIVEPGDDIDPGEFSFSFGKKIGVKLDAMISQVSESTGRDYVHTVWMHSHPGLGLFLSSHDLLVQKQLAYTDAPMRMAAFVIDTNTPNWDLAIFTSKTDGTMNNKEDLSRIYSLDELYQWSRSAHARQDQITPEAVAPMSPDMDNYYVVQINHQGTTRTLNLYFSGKTINTMDDILYQYVGQKKLGGYLIGARDGRGNYLFDDCSSEKTDSAIGILVIDAESAPESVVQSYCGDTTLHCVVVCRDNDEMWILTRETNEKPFNHQTDLFVCSMRPMKEWLRRKRVYK